MTIRNIPGKPQNDGSIGFQAYNWIKQAWTWMQSMANPAVSQTASFTPNLSTYYYPCSNSAGNVNVTLPLANTCLGKQYLFKKTDSAIGEVALISATGDTIDGQSNKVITQQYSALEILSDGINTWHVVGANAGASPIGSKQNWFMNGGFEVAQRAVPTMASTFGALIVTQCDRWKIITGGSGAATAGTVIQATNATGSRTGFGLRCAGFSTPNNDCATFIFQNIESKNALNLKNSIASLRLSVLHDFGSNLTVSISISKATVLDNFAAVTGIGSQSFVVPTGTETVCKFENTFLGDCTNGLQIVIGFTQGIVVTKNFTITEAVLVEGGQAPDQFIATPFEVELAACKRYFQKSFAYATAPAQSAGNVGAATYQVQTAGVKAIALPIQFSPTMRTTPAITFFSPGASSTTWRNITGAANSGASSTLNIGDSGFGASNAQAAADALGNTVAIHWTAEAEL